MIRTLIVAMVLSGSAVAAEPNLSSAQSSRAASYEPVNCEGAPKESVLKLSPPAASYALIFCSPTGHTLAPVDGFIWFPIDQPGRPYLFSAATRTDTGRERAYFSNQASRSLVGEGLVKANKMLERGYQITQQFKDVAQLDIATADGLLYNIFFYIAGGRPVYVLGCINQCNTSALLKEYSLGEAKAVLRK